MQKYYVGATVNTFIQKAFCTINFSFSAAGWINTNYNCIEYNFIKETVYDLLSKFK